MESTAYDDSHFYRTLFGITRQSFDAASFVVPSYRESVVDDFTTEMTRRGRPAFATDIRRRLTRLVPRSTPHPVATGDELVTSDPEKRLKAMSIVQEVADKYYRDYPKLIPRLTQEQIKNVLKLAIKHNNITAVRGILREIPDLNAGVLETVLEPIIDNDNVALFREFMQYPALYPGLRSWMLLHAGSKGSLNIIRYVVEEIPLEHFANIIPSVIFNAEIYGHTDVIDYLQNHPAIIDYFNRLQVSRRSYVPQHGARGRDVRGDAAAGSSSAERSAGSSSAERSAGGAVRRAGSRRGNSRASIPRRR